MRRRGTPHICSTGQLADPSCGCPLWRCDRDGARQEMGTPQTTPGSHSSRRLGVEHSSSPSGSRQTLTRLDANGTYRTALATLAVDIGSDVVSRGDRYLMR